MNFRRRSYQLGSLSRERRKAGPDVWIFRWRARTPEGIVVNHKVIVGTVEEFPTKASALKAVEPLRPSINAVSPAMAAPKTVRQLVAHYVQTELPTKAYSTQRTIQTSLASWVLPNWGEYHLEAVKAVDVETWLRSLPLADATKAKIRNVMHVVFTHACRYEWSEKNPISFVRQSGKREKLPDVLDLDELKKLLGELKNPARILVFLMAATGLRVSEALGLRWSDIDFTSRVILLSRAVVHQHVGNMKTECSQRPIPIDGALLDAVQNWRLEAPYQKSTDWVFASPHRDGEKPYWPESQLKGYVQPMARKLGITKSIGWHSFRRTFATLLNGGGEDVKTVQDLMRHANSRVTLDIYIQAPTPAKRAAHIKLVGLIHPRAQTAVVPLCSHAEKPIPLSA